MGFLIDWFSRAAQWIHDFLLWLPLHIWKAFLGGCSDLINAIPAPSFFSSAVGWVAATPSSVAYFLSSLNISSGLTMVLTAYVLRFLIRRIPFIG